MPKDLFESYKIDHIEIYSPMAKPLVFWHTTGLGFTPVAYKGWETGFPGVASYMLVSRNIRLVITSSYPSLKHGPDEEVYDFIHRSGSGVAKIALNTSSVQGSFEMALSHGAVPLVFPHVISDKDGHVEKAAVRLYDNSQLVFVNRRNYRGVFLPGYEKIASGTTVNPILFDTVDHIASELRINEIDFWTRLLEKIAGVSVVQQIRRIAENKTGMILNIAQTASRTITMVMAEPADAGGPSKVQENIDNYGPGIHHLAFSTNDIQSTVSRLRERGIEMVSFPASYYRMLRQNPDLKEIDIDRLEDLGILVDREGDGYLFQKFIRPFGDKPFFMYEIVERVNGYSGFALNNINVLKKAEEAELMQVEQK